MAQVSPGQTRAADARVTRRRLVTGAAAGVAAIATRAANATAPETAAPDAAGASPLSGELALHVARRLTYGPTPALIDELRTGGVDAWLSRQLNPTSIPDYVCEAQLATIPTYHSPTAVTKLSFGNAPGRPIQDAQAATLLRAVQSERQLFEIVVEVFNDHLGVFGYHVRAGVYRGAYDREVIRAHAFGRYADMLKASAQHPAMLHYLDNASSTGKSANENYGRELLELHTLGVRGGYTERDVRNAALTLTGWGVDDGFARFAYTPANHYVGPVQVVGWRSANATADGGVAVGESLLLYLARHPSTARHLAWKLARRLISDTPSRALVESLAKVYLANDTAIVPVLRALIASKEFRSATGTKYRRPYEHFVGMVRALGMTFNPGIGFSDAATSMDLLRDMGQAPFEHHPPDGYADTAVEWLSSANTLARWNAAQSLVQGSVGELSPLDVDALLGTPAPTTAGPLVDRIASRVVLQKLAPAHRGALLAFVGLRERDAIDDASARAVAPQLAALLLSSPYLALR